jgi:signal transduction histidine kinase
VAGRPRVTDGLVVGFNVLLGCLSLLGTHYRTTVTALTLVLVVAAGAALWWRRSHPLAVLLLIAGVTALSIVITPDRDPSSPAIAFGVYAVSAYADGRTRLAVAGAAIVLLVGAVALLLLGDLQGARRLLPAGVISLVAWIAGDYLRSRRQFMLDLVARHQMEREQAAEAERLRIARELHDVVAHNVSVMAIQAGAARVSGGADEQTLESIEQGARDTLSELNRLLGVLRKSQGAPELAPQPTLNEVEALLRPARDAGLEATAKVTGEKRPLPAAVDLSAYRIVQEAVTNVLKHANATRVEVLLDYFPEAIEITVTDNGSGAPAAASNGHGLVGMRERVSLFGGELTTGSSTLGGFTVRATLPLKT